MLTRTIAKNPPEYGGLIMQWRLRRHIHYRNLSCSAVLRVLLRREVMCRLGNRDLADQIKWTMFFAVGRKKPLRILYDIGDHLTVKPSIKSCGSWWRIKWQLCQERWRSSWLQTYCRSRYGLYDRDYSIMNSSRSYVADMLREIDADGFGFTGMLRAEMIVWRNGVYFEESF